MHAWWSELRSRALLPAIEPAPGTVEALHAVLGGPHLVPATRDYFCVLWDPAGQYGKIVPSRSDQMRPPEICNSGTAARVQHGGTQDSHCMWILHNNTYSFVCW